MSEAFRWWLILEVLAAITLPLCLAFFRRLPDRGYSLSKAFALLLVGYLFWMLNSIHLLPNSNRGVLTALVLIAALSAVFVYRERDDLLAWGRAHWPYIAGVEVAFIVVFAVATWARSLVGFANITEQPMDLMFLNAATHAGHFPPKDPWLSGHTVAYYYFGYLIVAMTGRLAGVPVDVAYNLGLAMIAALAFIGAAGIVYNLVAMREGALEGSDPRPPRAPKPKQVKAQSRRDGRAQPPRSLYAVLGVTPRASDEQIRRAHESLSEKTRAVAASDPAASARLAEIDAAYGVLSAPDARRDYDRALHAGTARPPEVAPAAVATAVAAPETPPAVETTVAVEAPAPASSERATLANWRPAVFGLAGGLLLVVMGNLEYLLEFMSAYGIGGKSFYDWVDIEGLTADLPKHAWYPASFFGFFRASRIYPLNLEGFQGITEFPMFSFVLGDLHPHVMALPFVLLVIGAALALYRSPEPLDITYWLERPLALVGTAIFLGGLAFLNTWDIATLAFLVVAVAFVSNFARVRHITLDLFVQTGTFAVPLLLLGVLLYVPFYAGFTSQADGIGAVISNNGITVPATRPFHLLLFWAPLFSIVLPLVGVRLIAARDRITPRIAAVAATPALIVVAAWVLLFGFEHVVDSHKLGVDPGSLGAQIADRGTSWLSAIFVAVALTAALTALWLELTSDDERAERSPAIFALLLSATALLLILGTEFFFVGDVFNNRMNTVFKLYYQAWTMLALAAGFSLYYVVAHWRFHFPREMPYRYTWGALAAVVLLGAALYPLGAAFNRAHTFDGDFHALRYLSPEERQGIDWLSSRAQGQDIVIAEAAGGDYFTKDTYARVSMASGAPAIIGWKGHEDQWRSGNCTACAGRFEDVTALYTSTDEAAMRQILDKYGVTYVYVGDVERRTYGDAGMEKFKSLPVVFQCGTVTIYRARGGGASTNASCSQ